MTEVIPQPSDAFPRLGALSKTASVEEADTAEYGGVVMAEVLHPAILRVPAQVVMVGGVSAVTVNVAEHVVTNGSQVLVYVKITVLEPPQLEGAPVELFVKTPLQPPPAFTVANHVAYFVLIAACVWQAASVVATGHVSSMVE